MARISLLSLDQEQADDEVVTDIEVLDSISQAEQGTSQSDVVNQAIDDHEQLGRLAEIVNNSGQGVDENTAEVVELAVESIRIRCGFKKPFKVSTESFSKSSTRAQASTVLVQNIQSIQERLGKNIAVAKEGMIDEIKLRL